MVDQSITGGRNIVKVRYYSAQEQKTSDREYTYYSEVALAVGEIVNVPVRDTIRKAVVSTVNVPKSEIQSFAHLMKTIPAGSTLAATGGPEPAAPEEPITPPAHAPDLWDDEPIDTTKVPSPPGSPEPEPAPPQESPIEPFPDNGGCIEPPQDEGPTEGEHVEQLWDERRALETGWPPALVTIERQVPGLSGFDLFQLYQNAAGLLHFAKDRIIATNDDLKPATDDLAIIATCKKSMTARKNEIVKPLKDKLDLVKQAFGDLMFPVEEADRLTRAQVTAFDNDQRVKTAEAKRIEDEKARLAREEAAFNGTGEITVPLGTIEEVAPPPERTRTDLGTQGMRDNWKARVVNFELLDDRFKLPNEQMLNALARTSKGTAKELGVEFYNDRSVTMRTR